MTIEIVNFPIENGGSFHSYVKVLPLCLQSGGVALVARGICSFAQKAWDVPRRDLRITINLNCYKFI